MDRKNFLVVVMLLLLTGVGVACQDTSRHATPPETIGVSGQDMILTLNAPLGDWNISSYCWYNSGSLHVKVIHPHIEASVEIGCTFETERGSGSCEVYPDDHLCDCSVPQSSETFTVTINGTSDPSPLTHTFSLADIRPESCEDDPAGWGMGVICMGEPEGTMAVGFFYPDSYDAVACDLILPDGTDVGCDLQPSDRFSTVCLCHGFPITPQEGVRQITLRDGTTITAPSRSVRPSSSCYPYGEPTIPAPDSGKSNPPPVQTCADQSSPDACKMLEGCYWWYSADSCNSSPETLPPACDTFNDEKSCSAGGCKWDPNQKPPCY